MSDEREPDEYLDFAPGDMPPLSSYPVVIIPRAMHEEMIARIAELEQEQIALWHTINTQATYAEELEAQLAEATEANTSCTRYIADQEIRIANLEHLLGDEDDDEDKPYYDTPGGF